MKKTIIIWIIFLTLQIFAMPAYKTEEENVLMTTFFPDHVLEFSSDTFEIVFSSRQNKQEYSKIVDSFRIVENLTVKDFPINPFFSGVVSASFDFVENFEISHYDSSFYKDILIPVKSRYLKEYMDSFKNGYEHASDFIKKINNNENYINMIFYKPGFDLASVEETAKFRGYNFSYHYFESFNNNVKRMPLESSSMKNFIINYAYSLGMISYLKMYYGAD